MIEKVLPGFEFFTGEDGLYYFRVRAEGNGEILMTSEGYTRKFNRVKGALAVQKTLGLDRLLNRRRRREK